MADDLHDLKVALDYQHEREELGFDNAIVPFHLVRALIAEVEQSRALAARADTLQTERDKALAENSAVDAESQGWQRAYDAAEARVAALTQADENATAVLDGLLGHDPGPSADQGWHVLDNLTADELRAVMKVAVRRVAALTAEKERVERALLIACDGWTDPEDAAARCLLAADGDQEPGGTTQQEEP